MQSYRNPIIPGFNPDPSCICVKGIFYLVTSSFLAFPGIPVYASRDLVNWTQIGNVVSRPSQLPRLKDCDIRYPICGGLWAPTIRHHNDEFFVTVTLVFPQTAYEDPKRWDNLLFKTKDPRLDWSEPIRFDYPGYDTSLAWDQDGVAYVQGSFYWRVRPEISQISIDTDTGATLNEGGPRKIWSGEGGKAPEAPHAYWREGYWWLIIAEGGTELGHRCTMARSRSLTAPLSDWERCLHNPVLQSIALPPSAGSPNNDPSFDSYFMTVGHADLFQSESNEQWFAVALATRDGVKDYAMGRETVLVPVEWEERDEEGELKWPMFGQVMSKMMVKLPVGDEGKEEKGVKRVKEGEVEDLLEMCAQEKKEGRWPMHLLFLRIPDYSAYTFDRLDRSIRLRTSSKTSLVDQLSNGAEGTTTFIARRQTDLEGSMTVSFSLPNGSHDVEAGLTVFLDQAHHFALTISNQTIFLRSTVKDAVLRSLEWEDAQTDIKVGWTAESYTFFVKASSRSDWIEVGTGKASDVSGGFTGVVIGPFALGDESKEVVLKDWRYESHRTW